VLRTLPSYVGCKSFACHSYENCWVYTNNSHFGSPRAVFAKGTDSSALRSLRALSVVVYPDRVGTLGSSSASPQPSKPANLPTFQRLSPLPTFPRFSRPLTSRGRGHIGNRYGG
jgi:hypothetical protein